MKWLRTFDIYAHNDGDPIAIKRGWSWPAFLWPLLWPYLVDLKPLFWTVGIISALSVKLGSLGPSIIIGNYKFFPLVLTPAFIGVILGAKGNSLKRNKVKEAGYRRTETVRASSIKDALSQIERSDPFGQLEPKPEP